MPITKQQFNKLAKQAAEDYAKKLKLEPELSKQLKPFFDGILKDFNEYYAKHSAAIGLNNYQNELEKILNDHHIKVGNIFSDNLRSILGNPTNNQAIQTKINANVKGFAAQRSHLMSHTIINTTRNNMEVSIKDAEVISALSETELSKSKIADVATNLLKDKFAGRIPLISTTETQASAENGKVTEYDTMVQADAEIDGEKVKEMTNMKIWIAILDDHTREAHAEADAQEVQADEPFEVDGEELMFPGDDSMGASEGNLINCRCSLQYFVE